MYSCWVFIIPVGFSIASVILRKLSVNSSASAFCLEYHCPNKGFLFFWKRTEISCYMYTKVKAQATVYSESSLNNVQNLNEFPSLEGEILK